ncbi:MAG: hypothetical protein H8E44_22990 [Planctomycetes bacterium]|nr:hypothetical protein [Planctomycetota bacterium]MBL7042383.1 hypothetical protein [Pirellulaceae bacterium]
MNAIWQALVDAKLVPQELAVPDLSVSVAWGDDLLPGIIQTWIRHLSNSAESRTGSAGAVLAALLSQRQRGAKLTWGIPGFDERLSGEWLGTRLAWWPRGVPHGRRVGLVSSRLGQDLDRRKSWFTVLRAACMKLDPQRDILLTAGSTTTARFARRCGQLFGLRVLFVDIVDDQRTSLGRWTETAVLAHDHKNTSCDLVSMSPPLALDQGRNQVDSLVGLPDRDRATVALSDRLVALHVRPRGHLDHLLRARLTEPDFPAASIYLALGPELVRKELADQLMELGAVGWFVFDAAGQSDDAAPPPWPEARTADRRPAPVISLPDLRDWPYLTHCTRRRHGPWPDEDENEFLDDLILDRAGADHSALAALWRIVRSRRLIASADLVRGDTSVVSFTAVPLSEIHQLHAFRSHLGRWDFEPYGVCIRRDWLERRGARPVVYCDEQAWSDLAIEDRPFFQKKESKTPSGRLVDWTIEREWRHTGDVPLGEIPEDSALLCVPSESEAEQLAAISRWPVVVTRWG